jgi:GNAT superfamily N-acetyltransferase
VIEVRDAVIDDAEAVATAHIEGWRAGYRGVVPDDYLDAEDFASSRRDRWRAWTWQQFAGSRLFVVLFHDRVVGFAHAGPEEVKSAGPPTGRGEIYGFYLHPNAWGSGGAAALMSRSEEFLRDEGYGEAVLWVLRDNPRARAFYEKEGWHHTGEDSTFTPTDPPGSTLPKVAYVVTQYAISL